MCFELVCVPPGRSVFNLPGLSGLQRRHFAAPLTMSDVRINYRVSTVFHCSFSGRSGQTHWRINTFITGLQDTSFLMVFRRTISSLWRNKEITLVNSSDISMEQNKNRSPEKQLINMVLNTWGICSPTAIVSISGWVSQSPEWCSEQLSSACLVTALSGDKIK